jgi:hypothetical protein
MAILLVLILFHYHNGKDVKDEKNKIYVRLSINAHMVI